MELREKRKKLLLTVLDRLADALESSRKSEESSVQETGGEERNDLLEAPASERGSVGPTQVLNEALSEAREQRVIKFPIDVPQLEEANFPPNVAVALAGKSVPVELLSVKAPYVRRAEPWDTEMLIDPKGECWSVRYPLQVFFTDFQGTVWRVPRHWVGSGSDWLHQPAPQPDSRYGVTQEHFLIESVHLPSFWDLLEINIPRELATAAAGKPTKVLVHICPDQPVRVTWKAPTSVQYRVPHTWRRRRVRLPARDNLMAQGVTPDVAGAYAGRIVSVNYHPGSLCCMPEHYRFRDEQKTRWPVRIEDCFLLSYGDAEEHHA